MICENLTLGIVLFAPRTTYPAHAHYGVTGSYISLSGATSENDRGVYVPGAIDPPSISGSTLIVKEGKLIYGNQAT